MGVCAPRGIYISLSPTLQSLRLKAGGGKSAAANLQWKGMYHPLFICHIHHTLCQHSLYLGSKQTRTRAGEKVLNQIWALITNFPLFGDPRQLLVDKT